MKLALRQFRVLMWKNWIIRKRHYLTTICELFFSLIANLIMIIVLNSISKNLNNNLITKPLIGEKWVKEKIWEHPTYNFENNLWKLLFTDLKILYSPKNKYTKLFMNEFEAAINQRLCINNTNIKYYEYENEKFLLDSYKNLSKNIDNRNLVGIVFEHKFENNNLDEENFLNKLTYKIRTSNHLKKEYFIEKETLYPVNDNFYLDNSLNLNYFLETQIFMNEAYLRLLFKKNNVSLNDEKETIHLKQLERQNLLENYYSEFEKLSLKEPIENYFINFYSNKILNNQIKDFLKKINFFLKTELPYILRNLIAKRMPYPSYKEKPPKNLIKIIPYVIINGFIILSPVIIKRMTDEKVNRIREIFRLSGLSDFVYFFSTFTNYLITIIPQVCCITFLYTIYLYNGNTPVFENTQPILLGFILIIFCIHLILMSMLISIPISRSILGIVFSTVFFLISSIPYYFLEPDFNKTLNPDSKFILQIFTCVIPNMAIYFIFRLIILKDNFSNGCHFNNIFELTRNYGLMSIGTILIIQILSCFVICLLIWYFDAVWPNEYKIQKSWFFPIKKLKSFFEENNNECCYNDYIKKVMLDKIYNRNSQAGSFNNKFFENEENFNQDKIALLICNLRKVYKSFDNKKKIALDKVNLKLLKGELTILLGHNGAGKTTLMNIITGMCSNTEGQIYINGYNIKTSTKQARSSLSFCPQQNILYNELTAEQHLHLYSVIKGEPSFRIQYDISVLLEKLQLTRHSMIPSKNLSGGMKRKLSLAIALIGSSKVLILDEPTANLDVQSKRIVWDLLMKEKKTKTILLSTHFLEEADAVGDKICIISKGSIYCYGTPVFLKRSFGTGYQLRIAKANSFSVTQHSFLDKLVKKYFNESKIYFENQNEIVYLLNSNNENSSSEQVEDGHFAKFLYKLENIQTRLGVLSFGISITTLEDVFIKVTSSNNFKWDLKSFIAEDIKKNSIKRLPSIDFRQKSLSFEKSVNENYIYDSYKKKNNSIGLSNLLDNKTNNFDFKSTDSFNLNTIFLESNFQLTLQRLKGLLIKRYLFIKRSYKSFLFQMFIPIFVFSSILITDKILRSNFNSNNNFHLSYNLMYKNKNAFSFYQHPIKSKSILDLYNGYEKVANLNNIKTIEVDSSLNLDNIILEKFKNKTLYDYFQNLIVSFTEKKDGSRIINEFKGLKNVYEVWYNNDAVHSLPISINFLYESIIKNYKFFYKSELSTKEIKIDQEMHINTINHPFPKNTKFFFYFTTIQQFKILWSLMTSLSLPFLAAYFAIFPIQEKISGSKLLQLMAGLSHCLYWFSNFVTDFLIHLIQTCLIIILFYLVDTEDIFRIYNESMAAIFILLLLYGICSIFIAYIYSKYASSVSSGYVLYVIFNLIFGLILSLCDYIIFYLTQYSTISKGAYNNIVKVFSFFPLYSMTRGIVKIYTIGSKSKICKEINSVLIQTACRSRDTSSKVFRCCPADVCKDKCYNYKSPIDWNHGVLDEIFMMSLCIIITSSVLIFIEMKIGFKNLFLFNFQNKTKINKSKNLVEDLDVSLERNRIDQLIATSDLKSLNKNDSLILQNISKIYKNNHVAVNKISFSVKNQECFGLLGINGAGKTTIFKMLVGELPIDFGNVYVNNYDLKNNVNLLRQQIGYCPQFDFLTNNMTGEETLFLYGRLKGIQEKSLKQKVLDLVAMTDLSNHFKNLCSTYSGGTKRKLSLAIALIGDPKVLILDEPTTGLSTHSRRIIWRTLNFIKKVHNCSILLTSHSMEECEALCSRIAIMVNGQFKCLGSIQHLRKKYGQGFSLTIKIYQTYVDDYKYKQKLKERLFVTFNQCTLKDTHHTVISYQILDSTLNWSYLFRQMDLIKNTFNLEYYLIGDTTLEQIFINFARQETY